MDLKLKGTLTFTCLCFANQRTKTKPTFQTFLNFSLTGTEQYQQSLEQLPGKNAEYFPPIAHSSRMIAIVERNET